MILPGPHPRFAGLTQTVRFAMPDRIVFRPRPALAVVADRRIERRCAYWQTASNPDWPPLMAWVRDEVRTSFGGAVTRRIRIRIWITDESQSGPEDADAPHT